MKKKVLFLLAAGFLLVLIGSTNSYAVELEAGDWKFGINGFVDGEYTYMGEMPMVMGSGMIMKMPDRSYFDQNHMNLIFGAEKGKSRVNINLSSRHLFSSKDGETKGEFSIEEAYGEYSFNDLFKLRAGSMLSPFGIYNDVLYITPLFATVVLPQMYLLPANYHSGNSDENPSVSHNLMPTHANIMLSGNYLGDKVDVEYYLYVSNGERGSDGVDVNKDKGVGARLRSTVLENYKFGFSYFTVNNDDAAIGRENMIGLDAEINLFDMLKFEAEYVDDSFEKREDRQAYYLRLTGYINSFSPFISYDFAEDKANSLFKRGQARYSIGTGYRLADNVTLKAEYHYHKFKDKDLAPAIPEGADTINMFRSSIIFIF